MSKYIWIPISIVLAGCLYYWVTSFTVPVSDETILKKIDSLNVKISTIKKANDSIRIIIDTTEVEIQHVYEKYIQVHDRIVTQSVDSDCVFFARYLSEDSKRYIDTINFEPVEAY